MITVFEYLQTTQAWVVDKLKQAGLMAADYAVPRKPQEPEITFAEAVELMRHDSYRRIKRVIRQVRSSAATSWCGEVKPSFARVDFP